jgi:hypothetical protein
MSTDSTPSQLPAGFPLLDRGTLMTLLAHPMRLAILTVLSDGEAYGITDVAPLIHCSASNCSKHLQQLKNAGILTIGRGRLYKIAPAYNPNPGSRTLTFGHCTMHLDVAAAAQP